MTLTDFIMQLHAVADKGYGNAQVYYRHGASGDCGPLSGAYPTTQVDECGPFDLDKNETYISIYAGD